MPSPRCPHKLTPLSLQENGKKKQSDRTGRVFVFWNFRPCQHLTAFLSGVIIWPENSCPSIAQNRTYSLRILPWKKWRTHRTSGWEFLTIPRIGADHVVQLIPRAPHTLQRFPFRSARHLAHHTVYGLLHYPVMMSPFLRSFGNYTRRAIFPEKCKINQSSVDSHNKHTSHFWLDWFIGFVPPDLFLRRQG